MDRMFVINTLNGCINVSCWSQTPCFGWVHHHHNHHEHHNHHHHIIIIAIIITIKEKSAKINCSGTPQESSGDHLEDYWRESLQNSGFFTWTTFPCRILAREFAKLRFFSILQLWPIIGARICKAQVFVTFQQLCSIQNLKGPHCTGNENTDRKCHTAPL